MPEQAASTKRLGEPVTITADVERYTVQSDMVTGYGEYFLVISAQDLSVNALCYEADGLRVCIRCGINRRLLADRPCVHMLVLDLALDFTERVREAMTDATS